MENEESQNLTAEENILAAARRVFSRAGYEGARMQEIADEAGVNKALLHYYFRSKSQLFDAIFSDAFKSFWPVLEPKFVDGTTSMKEIIWLAVNGYMDILMKMPYLPTLIVGELNRSPEKVESLFKMAGVRPEIIVGAIQKGIENGEVYSIEPRDLVLNVLGMLISPFLSEPLLAKMFFSSPIEFNEFLERRRKSLYQFICRGVLVNPEI